MGTAEILMRELVVPLGTLRRTGELALAVLGALPDMSVLVFDAEQRYVLAGGTTLEAHGLDAETLIGGRFGELVARGRRRALGAGLRGRAARRAHARFEYASEDGAHVYDVAVAPDRGGRRGRRRPGDHPRRDRAPARPGRPRARASASTARWPTTPATC